MITRTGFTQCGKLDRNSCFNQGTHTWESRIAGSILNFIAAFGFGTHTALMIGKGLIDTQQVNEWVILSAVLGAITRNTTNWYPGLRRVHREVLVGGRPCGSSSRKIGLWRASLGNSGRELDSLAHYPSLLSRRFWINS
ncbi:MAG: hypothetical protein IPJ07_14615 [Acidobacteria bacterium]|nr:hypothetical protein [Acidobacteriota bacterium]